MRCTAYRSETKHLWGLMEAERGLGKEWRWLEEEEKVKVLLGQDMCMEGGERIDRSVKSYLRKVMIDGTSDKNTTIIYCMYM